MRELRRHLRLLVEISLCGWGSFRNETIPAPTVAAYLRARFLLERVTERVNN
jgi:hypothetical protein